MQADIMRQSMQDRNTFSGQLISSMQPQQMHPPQSRPALPPPLSFSVSAAMPPAQQHLQHAPHKLSQPLPSRQGPPIEAAQSQPEASSQQAKPSAQQQQQQQHSETNGHESQQSSQQPQAQQHQLHRQSSAQHHLQQPQPQLQHGHQPLQRHQVTKQVQHPQQQQQQLPELPRMHPPFAQQTLQRPQQTIQQLQAQVQRQHSSDVLRTHSLQLHEQLQQQQQQQAQGHNFVPQQSLTALVQRQAQLLPSREAALGQAAPPRTYPHGQRYPQPAADHQAVCDDGTLFLETLEKLQRQLGINEKVPRVGGRELHLHTLYCQVTSLGGCEQVIASKQWREVAEPFHFPETITSVSYSLRKAYINHLWDYEQVYYFRRQGPRLIPPAGTANGCANGFDEEYARPGKKRKTTNDVVATTFPGIHPSTPITLTASAIGQGAPAAACVGQRGTVVVDSRFDAGYFVTVRIGKQDFRGMLYYPPPESLIDLPPLAQPRKPGRPRKEDCQDQIKPSKKDKANRDRDPLAPKPNKTPFNFFSVDARVKAKDIYPAMSQTDITKKVGEMWQNASEEEKSPYVAMSNQDKARYQAELESYNFRLASQAAAQQASQAAVAVSAAQHAMASQPLQVGGEVFNSSLPLLAGPLPQMQPFDLQPAAGPDAPDPL